MGPLEINGKKYDGQVPMTPFGGMLKDDELAAVLTFVRNSFGNQADPITAGRNQKGPRRQPRPHDVHTDRRTARKARGEVGQNTAFAMKPHARFFALALSCIASSIFATAAEPPPKPNIVFIFADDWGWGDLSCHGHPWLKTPNLDRLASEGTDFQQFNVLNPVCSPSRTAVMTGHYPARFSVHQHFAAPAQNHQRNMPDWLDPKAPTLPRFLKAGGLSHGAFRQVASHQSRHARRAEAGGVWLR